MFEALSQGFSGLSDFHFLRPWWLCALLPGVVLSWFLFRRGLDSGRWQNVISKDLLPFLLDGEQQQINHRHYLWAMVFWLMTTFAMAGPSWTNIPLPIHKQQAPLVILLDLSPSMLAEDLKPNRLTHARLKLTDLLGARKEGTTALVAYADDAHLVTPLTDDTATIIALIPSLHPNIMPVAGSQPLRALEKGMQIILQAGHQNGDLLLVSDGLDRADVSDISEMLKSMSGFRLSVLALGSEAGAPIPSANGDFVKTSAGDIVIAKLSSALLRKVALNNDGIYTEITTDNSDIERLTAMLKNSQSTDTQQLERTFDTWQDNGFWLAIIAIPLILAAFRRNLIALILISPFLLHTENSYAVDLDDLSWKNLWQSADQQAQQAFDTGDTSTAQERFKDPKWRASAAYRNEKYDTASELFADDQSATGRYNLANSLAKTGQLEEAIKAYNEALSANPDHQDAAFNKKLVEESLKQEQQNQDKSQDGQQDQNQDKSGEQSESDQNQQNSDKQNNSDQSKADESDSKPEKPAESEQKQDASSDKDEQKQDQDQNKSTEQKNADTEPPQDDQKNSAEQQNESDLSREQRQAMEQWLRRVPDDPGGLLRRKFEYETWLKQQSGQHNSNKQESQRW